VQRLRKVVAYDVFADKWMLSKVGTAGPMLSLPESRVGEEEPYSDRDIAAFSAGGGMFVAGNLAMKAPRVGDPIWLGVNRGLAATGRTMEAVVVECTERTLIFRFVCEEVPLFTSGAPLLDRDGGVVGINVGGGSFGGRRFGHANHVMNIHRHLKTANYVHRDARPQGMAQPRLD